MTDRHTPGPWRLSATPYGDDYGYIENEHNIFVATIIRDGLADPNAPEANARLIAAAPRLLEALREVRIYLRVIARESAPDVGNRGDAVAAIQTIDEAITAATGEEVSA